MKAVIQRVDKASVEVESKIHGQIMRGILVLFGCYRDDTEDKIDIMVDKLINFRIFEDENGKMNFSLKDINGEILIVSQFTLLADTKKGRRPSFIDAMEPIKAKDFYDKFVLKMKREIKVVQTGVFGAKMKVSLINDGPVTFILDV